MPNVWVVPLTVAGVSVDSAAFVAPVNVTDSVPPMQAAGIDDSTRTVTTFAVDVHETPTPLSDPQAVTAAWAEVTCFDAGETTDAPAAPGTATIRPTTAEAADARRIPRYPVMTTETPVTLDAATLFELKSGVAAPVTASSVPVTSASETLDAPVSVTL